VDASGGTCGTTGCDESFSYDVNGNRTMTGYTTGTGNRLTSDGTYSYTYDDDGNTLTKTRISDGQKYEFGWDYRDRLTQVLLKNSSGTVVQQSDYTYDAFNRRIIKSFDDDGPGPHTATVTKTIYDGASFMANSYADFDGSNTLTVRYLYGPAVDMILARRDTSGTVAWYLADHLGSVRDIAATSGTVLDHISYSTFGKVMSETNASNGDRWKYTGREYDSDSGSYFFRARFHDPSSGRFTAEDPLGFAAKDMNRHRYVRNAPTNGTDPLGLFSPVPSGEPQLEIPHWDNPPETLNIVPTTTVIPAVRNGIDVAPPILPGAPVQQVGMAAPPGPLVVPGPRRPHGVLNEALDGKIGPGPAGDGPLMAGSIPIAIAPTKGTTQSQMFEPAVGIGYGIMMVSLKARKARNTLCTQRCHLLLGPLRVWGLLLCAEWQLLLVIPVIPWYLLRTTCSIKH
jgi:RHS repeat-associated protein